MEFPAVMEPFFIIRHYAGKVKYGVKVRPEPRPADLDQSRPRPADPRPVDPRPGDPRPADPRPADPDQTQTSRLELFLTKYQRKVILRQNVPVCKVLVLPKTFYIKKL